ncbi:SCO1664 family protein [Brachybacterium huguangmaarense]|nr:SCO1664 family protein [Brachybacterium huguangmaarense]
MTGADDERPPGEAAGHDASGDETRDVLAAETFASEMLGLGVTADELTDPEAEAEEERTLEALGMHEDAGTQLDDARADELLRSGAVELLGHIVSSNETFLVRIEDDTDALWGIYKPVLGERPLHDFPPGLHRRERAAYLVSETLGWHVVPRTVLREDGLPFGEGSLQRFVVADPAEHYFTLYGTGEDTDAQLRRLAVFDLLVNNADRKAGHVLRDEDGRVWGIDHGLCLHEELKLRTVIWDFAGAPVEPGLVADVAALVDDVPAAIADLLTPAEVRALQGRARYLLASGALPHDRTGMRFPWPLI